MVVIHRIASHFVLSVKYALDMNKTDIKIVDDFKTFYDDGGGLLPL